ncbi:sulfurtransferase [Paenibacillus lemnae]|uniref:Sulfurtransferase n=1 Tax=Paenibacillus lemnae TaxID=1330551 RepID=A0A848M433_PAELE|nr:sulfurtransferase [Paenibacillus lemnae]NMO95545.1 sulfurtransferase [Paenibacillus lemnae]
MSYRVSKQWLLARLYEHDLIIVDCRFTLGDRDKGRLAYEEAHIPRAVYMDLETDLSAPVSQHGGRHPLPEVSHISQVFGKAGISQSSRVVIYDDQGGMVASRLWWMLKYTGHEQAYIMDEGFSSWKDAHYPVTADVPIVIPASYEPKAQPVMLSDMEEVRQASKSGAPLLIDSRETRRYAGLEEPIDHTAGHIPGAVNYFWKDLLNAQGRWKSRDEIKMMFAEIPLDHEIIVYCGSGVSACPNVLALKEAGYSSVKLYAGSWSDWISYEGNPVAKGEE